jgi:heterodisulfide reductase subunit B
MKIAYFPGCTLKSTARNFEQSAMECARTLGVEMVELARWNCCGVVSPLATDDLFHHLAPIRNLIRVQEARERGEVQDGSRVVTLCSMCYNVLKRSNLLAKENPASLKTINDFMYTEKDYDGGVEVVHLLQVLRDIGFDKIKEQVRKPLEGLKVVAYYGCMLLRPREVGIDDPENATIQEELLEALGAETVRSRYRMRCCGSYQTVRDKGIVAQTAYEILGRFQKEGAEVVVTSCPLCAFNLDGRQEEVLERYSEFKQIPVLYFTQLMALALGLGEECCGFDLNFVDPRPLLREKNLLD